MEQETTKLLNKTFLLAAILVIGVLVFFVGQLILQNQSVSLQNQNQITVSGEGKVYVKPDIAVVSFGVKSTALTVAEVTKDNTKVMNAVIETVKTLGIGEKDIQTTNYNLRPNYNYTQDRGQIFEGYILEQNVQVKIRDFTKIGDVLSKATGNGANLVGSLQFTIDDPQQVKEEARAKAIAQAKANAQNLAKESGIRLGKLINVYENSNYYPVAYSAKGMGGGIEDSVSVPTIQPGQQEVSITINLTYQVK